MAGWYRQGTVALTPGSAAVTGAGTMWLGVVRPGSAFTTDGRTLYEIREVANDHTLTLDRPWEGETAAASAYAVIAASATLSNAELAGEIAAMVAKWAVREDQYDDWLGGSPNGGPNGDGKYPLTDSKGVTRLVESPARLLQLLDDGVVEHAAQIIAAIEDDVAAARQAATEATAAMTAVSADRQAVAQAAAAVAAQAGESTAAAATATAQAAIAVQRAGEAAGSAAAAAGLEASATAALSAVETARDIVLEARTEAGTAASGALSSRTAAEAARDTATAARDAALEARDAAETARTQAQDWAVKTDAPVSGNLKSALSYALDAASQATSAAGKAVEAAGSAAAAAASATDLDTAAADAQAAASDAATGAQTATAKAAAAALSADIARSAAQQAETAGAGSATARTAAEAARDSAATAMTAAQVAASQAGQSQTNAANSAQTAATAAADAISAKSDASSARDLAVAARTEAQGARDLAQAFAQGAVGYQPSPGVYSAFHWSEQAKGHAQTAATIVGGSNFGIVGDGTSQRFAADSPGSLLNLVQAPGGKLTFNPGSRAVSFGFDAVTAPVAPSGGITAGTVQGALEEIDHRLSTLSQDSIANGGGSVRVTEGGAVEIAPAAGQPATYRGGELHSSATAYSKAETDAAIAAMVTAGRAAGAAKLTTPRTIALSGGVTGSATAFDGTQDIAIPVTAVAASALTGTIDIARLPAGALERLYPVASDAERFALTTAQVQKGDTVQVGGTGGLMYLVVDESNLGNAAGYRPYTASRASAVDWSGVENKPALLTALASLDSTAGVLTQTGAGTGAKRAIGVTNGTDIPDRAAADGRYAQLGANNVLSGAVSIQNSAATEAIHVGNSAGTKFTFVGWNDASGFGRIGAYGSSAWQNFAISEGGSLTAIGTTAMPTGGAKLNVATGIQVDNKDVWHTGNLVPSNYAAVTSANTFNGKQTIIGTGANLPSDTGIASAIADTAGFEIQSQGIGTPAGAAFMSFHRLGNYAVHVGLDTDNEFKIGGWSMGGVAHKFWHAGNLVPSNYAAVTSVNTFNGKQTIIGTGANLPSDTGIASAIADTAGFEIQSQGIGAPAGAAFMSFHRPGNYAVHVGLDTDNEFKIGGWSMGGVAHKFWHAGNLPVTVSGNVVDFKANPTVNGQPLTGNSVTKSAVTVLPATGTIDVPAKSILSVYSQFIGQAFNVDYNTEAQYTQENAATGTDQVGGAFQLYNTAGAQIDSATKLLIHADGTNGSTEIVDERGITPFGTHCSWFDGASSWKVPSSYKLAWGSAQNFTYECWFRAADLSSGYHVLFGGDISGAGVQVALNGSTLYWYNGSNVTNYGTVSVDTWYHIALVRYNGTTKLYLNGVSGASAADTTAYVANPCTLGASANTSYFTGWMDQFRVSRTARYTANFTPPTAAFVTDADTVHLFAFDDGHGGQVLKDRSVSGHEVQIAGNAALSSTSAKFGTTSLNCANDSGGGALVAANKAHLDFYLGSDDFTIDFHAKINSLSNTNNILFVLDYTNNWGIDFRVVNGGNIVANISTNNTSYNFPLVFGASASLTLGVWHHFALVRSGAYIYGFLDGVLKGSVNVGTASITSWNSSYGARVALGRAVGSFGGYALDGFIDEFRVKRGEAVWTSNFTVPTTPHTADDRTVLLLHFEGAQGDKVTLDSSGSSYGINSFGDATTPSWNYVNSPTLSSTWTRGGHSTALKFDGSGPNHHLAVTYAGMGAGHPWVFPTGGKFCMEMWVYLPALDAEFTLLTADYDRWRIYIAHNGMSYGWPRWLIGEQYGVYGPQCSVGWNHIALVRDGRGYVMYTNGVAGASPANPQVNLSYSGSSQIMYVGTCSGGSQWLKGAIDAIRITNGQPRYTANFTPATLVADDMTTLMWEFNGAVGQKWVKELSQNTALIAANGNARTVKDGGWIGPVLTGANISTSTTNSKFGGASMYTNQTSGGNYYQLWASNDWLLSGDFTIDFWTNAPNYGDNTLIDGPFRVRSGGSGQILFELTNGATIAGANTWMTSQNRSQNVWTHVAIVRSGSTLTTYFNGNVAGQWTGISGNLGSTTGVMRLFNKTDGTLPWSGYTDELRISVGTARWTTNFTPPTIAYGQQYVTGPFYVATLNSSRIDVSDWSTIHSATITQTTPPGTSIKWLVSFDGRATWRKWDGSAWVVVPLNNGSSIDTDGNDYLTMQTVLTNLNVESYSTIDFAFSLKTANPNFSPSVDAVTLARDEYELGAAKIDYTIKRNGAAGAETHRITNLKAYPVNVVYDYVA